MSGGEGILSLVVSVFISTIIVVITTINISSIFRPRPIKGRWFLSLDNLEEDRKVL